MPKGFLFNAVSAGIKAPGRLDLGLIFSERPSVAVGTFTTNLVKAAPVLIGQSRLPSSSVRGILVNSGCANACTGSLGLEDAERLLKEAARLLAVEEKELLPASTGVIGERLPLGKMLSVLPELVSGLSADKVEPLAQAIMTTDTFPKVAERVLPLGSSEVRLLGIAKGAGMIAPHMATMLAFILTDAQIPAPVWQDLLREAVNLSFNRITVDGDMSTNDTVYALANGASGLPLGSQDLAQFSRLLKELCQELAYLIVKDGEGATKTVRIRVCGAEDEEKALTMARTVANSLLVKTAFFGEDPNWGRILAALGRSGVEFDPYQVDLFFDEVCLVKNGLSRGKEAEAKAYEIMKKREFTLTILLKRGNADAEVWTSDLSYEYVKINAEYRT